MSVSKLAAANTAAALTAGSALTESIDIIITALMFVISLAFYTLTYLERTRHHKVMEKKNEKNY